MSEIETIEIESEEEAIAALEEGLCLGNIPKHLRSAEVCLRAVQKRGEDLRYVPHVLRTPELCAHALSEDVDALRYVPVDMREDLVLPLLRNRETTIGRIDHDLQTPAMAACGFASEQASGHCWDIWDIREDLVDHAVMACVPTSETDTEILLQFGPNPDSPISGDEEKEVYIEPIVTWYDWMEVVENETFFATSWREVVSHLEHRDFRLHKGGCTGESIHDHEDEDGFTYTKILVEVYPRSPKKKHHSTAT